MSRRLFAVAALAVCFFAPRSEAQVSCTPPVGWPAPLLYFCPDDPARADQVNGNFRQLVTWLEAKVGPVGQTFAIPLNSVSTNNIVDGGVTAADLAPNAVETAALADGAVTSTKIAGRVPVYLRAPDCSNAGEFTPAATCAYTSVQCGTCPIGLTNLPRFENCSGACPACTGGLPPPPQNCTANNTLRGYLVGP